MYRRSRLREAFNASRATNHLVARFGAVPVLFSGVDELFHTDPPPDFSRARIARVAVERGIESARDGLIEHALTYRIDDDQTAIGDRVRVPLGRGNKPAEGVVIRVGGIELLDGLDPRKVKAIVARTGSRLPASLIALAEWMAVYYVCPLGMVLATMMPAAVKKGVGLKTTTLLQRADASPELPEGSTKAFRSAWARLLAADTAAFPADPRTLAATLELSPAAIKKLTAAGLLIATTKRTLTSTAPQESAPGPVAPRPTLTTEQHAAVEGVCADLGRFHVHLLRGVTGSGKTEVYLRVIEAAMARGKTAIVLVPEIALTPQTSRRFLDRFGPGRVAVLHSGLTASQRHGQWAACATGAVRVVVGARSAIFAPLPDLGLIVVDEEHDSSYKQDQLPRYHARDVAVKRGHLEGLPVLLGSATPSLESWANARVNNAGIGKYRLWTLATRATGAPMPPVEIVDLAMERRVRAAQAGPGDRHLHLVGPTLERALGDTLNAGGQAILLLNRRGYANYLCCPDPKCGYLMHCRDCDATMIYHLADSARGLSAGGFVRCHHCLAEQLLPRKCPDCGKAINTFGLGTQRVEEELERKFAIPHGLRIGTTLLRVDGDTMRSARDYFDALGRFADGSVRVLLGTQMIAKGLDFPNVRLVGVVHADTALSLPDFRALERTFQLVSQVAGRAGRGKEAGRVIVQTMEPRSPAIVLAAAHHYEKFADQELAIRTRAGLPPVGRMARVVCRDEDHAKAHASAGAIADALQDAINKLPKDSGGVRLKGPMPCPISRVAAQYRVAIEILAQTRGVVQTVLAHARAQGLLKSDQHTAIDVDPVALL